MLYAASEAVGQAAAPLHSVLPLLLLVVPVAGAIIAAAVGKRESLRNVLAACFSLATLGLSIALAVRVLSGNKLSFDFGAFISLPGVFSFRLEVDGLGAVFALLTSIAWAAAMIHLADYSRHEERRTRFYFWMLLSEAMTLGVFLAPDFFTLYIFFELMGLAGYMLVVHDQTAQARAAAAKYIYLAVMGGLSLLGGIFLYFYYAGTLGFTPAAGSAYLEAPFRIAAVVLMLAGFGVKAGVVPLHVWLPDAHPAAPSPASAILSGVMIKTGAYGIIRVVMSFFAAPAGAEAAPVSSQGSQAASGFSHSVQALGFAVIWLGLATMFVGMVLALFQSDIKRTLAYSSVSQMGYILLGVGCAGYLGAEGAMGLSGAIYHVLNHGLFKACLFLAAGAILFRAHELNMFELGGLWRKMPLTTVFWCIASLGIMGVPLFNGFVSKTLLHEAILESGTVASHAGAVGGPGWFSAVEWIFIITSGGTICYILKTTWYTFFRRQRQPAAEVAGAHRSEREQQGPHAEVREAPRWILVAVGALAAGVLFFGLFPGLIIARLVTPAQQTFAGLEGNISGFDPYTLANAKQILLPLALGVGLLLFMTGLRLWNKRLPAFLGIDYWYRRAVAGFFAGLRAGSRGMAWLRPRLGEARSMSVGGFQQAADWSSVAGKGMNRGIVAGWQAFLRSTEGVTLPPARARGLVSAARGLGALPGRIRLASRRLADMTVSGSRRFALAVRSGRYADFVSTFHWDLGIGVVGISLLLAIMLVILIK